MRPCRLFFALASVVSAFAVPSAKQEMPGSGLALSRSDSSPHAPEPLKSLRAPSKDTPTVSITVKDARAGVIMIAPTDPVTVVLTFSNPGKSIIDFRIHDRDLNRKLPYPVGCSVRFTDAAGNVHPDARANGEWWSQYIIWSTLFIEGEDAFSLHRLLPGEEFRYEVSLAEVLAGGEWFRGWPYYPKTGFVPGRWLFRFRYNDRTSEEFTLIVQKR